MADRSQSYANHVRIVPGFHYGVLGVLALNVVWSLVRLWRTPGLRAIKQRIRAWQADHLRA